MITIKLQGGLGNQLFEYAYGRKLELSGKKVRFDTSFFHGNKASIDTSRNFKLGNYNIATKAEFSDRKHLFKDLLDKILIKVGAKNNGFWQSEKYFSSIEADIRKELTLKEPLGDAAGSLAKTIMGSPLAVSMHVRRGDYVTDANTNRYHGTCSPEYYQKALEYIASKIGGNDVNAANIHVFVFAEFPDDIDWIKQNIPVRYPATYVLRPEIKDYEEVQLMSLCRHHIIANSSFSWWGAWLDPRNDKIVVAPKRWTKKDERKYRDIVPASWIRM